MYIEVKHRVTDWAVAKECMSNVMSRVAPAREDGKLVWIYH
ncbi:hypothetical protein [Pseudonocardia asaccharolytica]|uniref:Uncharacterized protein n=1 Tax=Pseudonocardia asaccharolytica DSM 44247 = NBRC 16224 TaxID=1123024 RepID=A0A511D697_9PSEU|nr:hypothetical protein [Pseudonocardia asaccharolytica]GEL19124.1 hypothetical protein PA7_29610 [Pseudonocardia asaccharolytica DSM 44247 = NBRC 16224]